MPRVAEVTGSEKSPPGGETAPTMLTLPSRSGLPVRTRTQVTRSVGGKQRKSKPKKIKVLKDLMRQIQKVPYFLKIRIQTFC